MKKYLALLLVLSLSLGLCACTASGKNSYFQITFIDVGQGDSALVECDGHYMLIDGGNKTAGDKVYNVLEEKGIQKLDILAISHLHEDHIGGLTKALTYTSTIRKTIANSDFDSKQTFADLESALINCGAPITVPHEGEKYELGSAEVEVVDNSSAEDNDSLVLLITYGKTRFLFTGDIEASAQMRISDKYGNGNAEPYKIDLMKLPHHGAKSNEANDTEWNPLYRFLRTFMPDYVIISVGADNQYGHPDQSTLDLLNNKTWKPKVYRTDENGDIIVKSNGKTISVEPIKK